MGEYVGRLAPSPTGLLHLGHAATFLTAAERASAAGGVLRFRNDDLDRARVREEFVTAMIADLRWLGLEWAEPVVVQSERIAVYRAAMKRLVGAGAVYPCTCSRRELQQMVSAPHEGTDDEPVYAGRCRPLLGEVTRGEAALKHGVNYRFRVPDGEVVAFRDGQCGAQEFRCGCDPGAAFGDFLVWRKDGLPSYQLACVVDDVAMGVTEVVRGCDLLKSTARQMLLQRALRCATPAYFHTPLLVDGSGVRLAKRHDALAIRSLRERGMTAAEVRAMAIAGSEPPC